MVFHGCNGAVIGFVNSMGYKEFAATNNVIMLFPDAACWGFNNSVDDADQLNKGGMMARSIYHMLSRATSANADEERNKIESASLLANGLATSLMTTAIALYALF